MQEDETSQEVWLKIANLFQSNKNARQMQLNEDLRNIELGDLTITQYCHKLKVTADLLDNIGKPIEESTLVMYTVNGLSEKYEQIAVLFVIESLYQTLQKLVLCLNWRKRDSIKIVTSQQ